MAVASIASAQSLDTEITVNHTIVPEERAAGRLRLLPTLQLPEVATGRLAPATSVTASPFAPSVVTLEPVGFASSLTRSPYKGYAALGYFPLYNLGASAGYRFIDNDTLTVGAMMQFNGVSYNSGLNSPEHLHRNNLVAGAGVAYSPDAAGSLKASIDYRFSNLNNPLYELQDTAINANMLNVGGEWNSKIGAFDYHAGASYGMAAFSGSAPELLTEHRGEISAGLTWHYNAKSAWSLDLGWEVASAQASNVKGIVSVEPRYDFTSAHFLATLGVRGDVYTGNGTRRTNYSGLFSPDLQLKWLPSDHFAVYGKFNGTSTLNSLAELYTEMPYMMPNVDYTFSRAFDAEAGVTLGPWRGGALTLYVRGAFSDKWLQLHSDGYFYTESPSGTLLGAKLDYSFRSYLTFYANLQWVFSDQGSYYPWHDNAKVDFSIGATIRPVTSLQILLGYHVRTDRYIPDILGGDVDLQSVSDLNASVHYEINSQWGVFANCNNILNHKYLITSRVTSQGVNAMVGATYKF